LRGAQRRGNPASAQKGPIKAEVRWIASLPLAMTARRHRNDKAWRPVPSPFSQKGAKNEGKMGKSGHFPLDGANLRVYNQLCVQCH
jgi:hypothetical protein